MQLKEVLYERECLAESIYQMGVDLTLTTKAILQQLKQDPASIKDYPFEDFRHRCIDRLSLAAKFQPQDASIAIGSVEENKVGDQTPPLLTMATSFVEISEEVVQQIKQRLAEIKLIMG